MEALSFFTLKAFANIVYNIYFHPLKEFPGPWLARATAIPFFLRTIDGNGSKWSRKLHQRYGKVVRVMPDELSFIDPAAWPDIYASRPQMPRPEKRMLNPNVLGVPPLLTVIRPEDHARQRRVWSNAFSERALKEQHPVLYKHVDGLVEKLAKLATTGDDIDISKWLQYATFDTFGDLCFGESFHSMESEKQHPWVDMLMRGVKTSRFVLAVGLYPRFVNLMSGLIPAFVKRWHQMKLAQHLQFAVSQIDKRLKKSPDHADFMKYILEKNTKNTITRDEVDSTMQIMIVAGSHTSAVTMTATVWFLLANPRIKKRLVLEVREAFSKVEDITIASSIQLPYLRACLMEALRLFPPTPLSSPREVEHSTVIAGHTVAPGTAVGVPHQTAYRHPSNFIEPNSFLPERWLADADPKFRADKKDACQPFLYGPRNCLGKNLAWTEMHLIFSRMLYGFDFELADSNPSDWTNQKIYCIAHAHPLNVRLKAARVHQSQG